MATKVITKRAQKTKWEKNVWLMDCILRFLLTYFTHFTHCEFKPCVSPTWWYSERMLCISSTSSLEISFTTKVRSYDVSSSPSHCPSSSLSGGLRARDTCWWERGWHLWTRATCDFSCTIHLPSETFHIHFTGTLFQSCHWNTISNAYRQGRFEKMRRICVIVLYFALTRTTFQDFSGIALVDVQ